MMENLTKNYVIVCGSDADEYDPDSQILNIFCNDKYEGLPEKVIKTFKFIVESNNFKNFNHFVKLDEDMVLNNLVLEENLLDVDYCGRVQSTQGNRRYHFNKFSKDNPNYNKPYVGPYVPWCLGGYGYIVSRRAIEYIKENKEFYSAIYEDLYIAILLNKNNIFPKNLNTRHFFVGNHGKKR